MSADEHLSQHQFMPVSELMNMHSNEALRTHRLIQMRKPPGPPGSQDNGPWLHGDHTRVSSLYEHKANDMTWSPELYHQLDEPIRSGTVDPVMLQHDRHSNVDEVFEGHHRIVRAHQLGVQQLPVTHGGLETQPHYHDWEDD